MGGLLLPWLYDFDTSPKLLDLLRPFGFLFFLGFKNLQDKKTVAPVEVPLNRIKSTVDAMVK